MTSFDRESLNVGALGRGPRCRKKTRSEAVQSGIVLAGRLAIQHASVNKPLALLRVCDTALAACLEPPLAGIAGTDLLAESGRCAYHRDHGTGPASQSEPILRDWQVLQRTSRH
jgi:hypothetical protein